MKKELNLQDVPFAHVVLGSGFAAALEELLQTQEISKHWLRLSECAFERIPGIKRSTVEGHTGKFCAIQNKPSKRVVLLQVGRLHGYEGHTPREVVAPLLAARALGVRRFILTNASGSLNPAFDAGDVMVIRDHVNFTGQNPLTGPLARDAATGACVGPRFPDLSALYDRKMGDALARACEGQGLRAHDGVYLGVAGPSFETPAEVRLFSRWGLDAVGMSTVWEAIALGHSGATVSGLSLISNIGCGLKAGMPPLDHHEILRTSQAAAAKILRAVLHVLANEAGEA